MKRHASRQLGFMMLAGALLLTPSRSSRGAQLPLLVADRDDDDANGVSDAEQARVGSTQDLIVLPLPVSASGAARKVSISAGTPVRWLVDGQPLRSSMTASMTIPRRAKQLALQAIGAGRGWVSIGSKQLKVRAISITALDGAGRRIDFAKSHASIQRQVPVALGDDPTAPDGDPDALRFVFSGVKEDLPSQVDFRSLSSQGRQVDQLRKVPLKPVRCPQFIPTGLQCASTVPIRAVADEVDARHPLVVRRSIVVQLGGALVLEDGAGAKLQLIRVGGPRRTAVGPLRRYRAALRVFLVRLSAKGSPPIGNDDPSALAQTHAALSHAGALWSSCGIDFGPVSQRRVTLVDPPPSHLLAVGCDLGLPTSGGVVRFVVDQLPVQLKVAGALRPNAAARQIAAAISLAGFQVRIADHRPMAGAAHGCTDLSVRRSNGSLANIDLPPDGRLSTDPTLSVSIGYVNLADGLQHFSDVTAVLGTLEERTLIKAYDDGDPTTIEVFVVPGLARGGRIGESFIDGDKGAIRNAVLIDRAGMRTGRASFTLAHELGHVLLDQPGHADDFGSDTPTRLMDSDAADPTAFGPRRLSIGECERVMRQHGPQSPTPLLTAWPWQALGATESAY